MKLLILLSLLFVHSPQPLTKPSPQFHRPFDNDLVQSTLYKHHQDRVVIFIYGGLLNEESAARSLSREALATRRLATAYGVKRLFNRKVPKALIRERYGLVGEPNQRGALNVQLTENPRDRVNGILFDLSWEDLQKLAEREEGYDLISVVVRPWARGSGPCTCVAYTFSAPDQESLTSSTIMPVPQYYSMVREGAASYGKRFLAEYLRTTYLADGKTTIAQWEKQKTRCYPTPLR